MSSVKYLGVVSTLALVVGCAGDTKSDSGTTTDTSPPAICYQQQGVDDGQIELTEDAVTIGSSYEITPAKAGAPATALPAGFDAADYYGAVDPAATADPWWSGWTVGGAHDGALSTKASHPLDGEVTPLKASTCVADGFADGGTATVAGATFPVCVVSADIEADATFRAGQVYFLTDTITVGTGYLELAGGNPTANAELTIEPGVMVYGAPGATSLVISRGSTINALGTAELPIVFGSATGDAKGITGELGLDGRGEWGGVVLSGFGETNSGNADGELITEAAPPDAERWYGGTNNGDSSGTMRYVVIAESGYEFRPDEEVQGLTLEAAGSGTTLEYIQILGSEDDCIEWFGGAAGIKWVVNEGCDDDGWDQDLGWTGFIQFGIHSHGAENGDHGIESDNNGGNFDAAPQTAPNIANITMIGNVGKGSSQGALHREGWRGKVFRSVYTDGPAPWANGCVDVDDALPAALQYRDVLVNCSAGALTECDD